jgi:magnesium-transporting ATPase (P-type)
MNYRTLRAYIAGGWVTCVLLVILAYVYAAIEPIQPDLSWLVTNLATVIGLLAPHLTLVYEFMLSDQPSVENKIERSTAYTIILMCTVYWVIFVAVVWAGVVFREFGAKPGSGLGVTTSVLVALAGALSFLAVKPTSKLFLLAHAPARGATGDGKLR